MQLNPIADYHAGRKRKRKSAQQAARKKRKRDTNEPSEGLMDVDNSSEMTAPDRPSVLNHLVVGINEVTKRLEEQVQSQRVTLLTTKTSPNEPPPPPLRLILVCRADINPPILVDHIPHLVAAYNSFRPEESIQLVPMQAGAELLLSQAIGLRRAAVLGFDSICPNLTTILDTVNAVPTLSATWLASSVPLDSKFIPTHIKQVRTSTPRDLKAEKQRRKEDKALTKEKRCSSNVNVDTHVPAEKM
ncbi:hypothetical protein C0991_007108 [Blastosporella zonata]|nr:hypothetical protein C0991_007108 [Blastosporella zonata]